FLGSAYGPTAALSLRTESGTIARCEAFTVRSCKVAKPSLLEVMGPLRVVATIVSRVAVARLHAIMVPLIERTLRTTEHVLVVVVEAVITPRRPKWIAIIWTIERAVSPHDYHSPLCLSVRARQESDDAREKQCRQNKAA